MPFIPVREVFLKFPYEEAREETVGIQGELKISIPGGQGSNATRSMALKTFSAQSRSLQIRYQYDMPSERAGTASAWLTSTMLFKKGGRTEDGGVDSEAGDRAHKMSQLNNEDQGAHQPAWGA